MVGNLSAVAMAGALFVALFGGEAAWAQKTGGILKMYSPDSPASMSIHEESTIAAGIPLMGVFNNLVLFDQHVAQNSLASIVPDLASDWSWDEAGTALTFRLRQSVKWHDGRPFTAADVKCTWDALAGKSPDKFRVNPRKSWYRNLDEVWRRLGWAWPWLWLARHSRKSPAGSCRCRALPARRACRSTRSRRSRPAFR